MSQAEILLLFAASPLGRAMHDIPWLFSVFETLHFIGLTLLIGPMLFVDLRMLGFFRTVGIGAVMKLTPVALGGFALNVVTGLGFFCNDPEGYWGNPMFRLKLAFIIAAGLNAAWFTIVETAKVGRRPKGAGEYIAPGVRLTAILSLFLWFMVILAGRLLPTFQGA